ncbi:hypothetical protein ZHAS_00010440 [Anopheles sinensis]|uniref:Uncharacterized protein n=1 Tax=Anopheles sinensis TaxID=74873 RepID=A0A084VXK7_ANOSI|nr:hypothetical protein ZHAS_00010440 [Anopheles sinensis]
MGFLRRIVSTLGGRKFPCLPVSGTESSRNWIQAADTTLGADIENTMASGRARLPPTPGTIGGPNPSTRPLAELHTNNNLYHSAPHLNVHRHQQEVVTAIGTDSALGHGIVTQPLRKQFDAARHM